jgi:hypothetical protein
MSLPTSPPPKSTNPELRGTYSVHYLEHSHFTRPLSRKYPINHQAAHIQTATCSQCEVVLYIYIFGVPYIILQNSLHCYDLAFSRSCHLTILRSISHWIIHCPFRSPPTSRIRIPRNPSASTWLARLPQAEVGGSNRSHWQHPLAPSRIPQTHIITRINSSSSHLFGNQGCSP